MNNFKLLKGDKYHKHHNIQEKNISSIFIN